MRQCFGCSELISIRTSPAPLDLISAPLGTGGHMNVNGGITEPFSRIPALEADLTKIMEEGHSYVALDQDHIEVRTLFSFTCANRGNR